MPRKDHVRRLQFSPSERELYDNIRTCTRDAFPELLSPQAATKANYFDTLAWIDKLRKICNHGLIVERLPLPPIRSVSPRSHGLENDATELLGSGSETVGVEESSSNDLLDHVLQSGIGSPVSITSGVVGTPMSQGLLQVDSNRGNSESESPRVSGCASPDPFAISTSCTAMPTKIQRLLCDLTDNGGDQKRYGAPEALPNLQTCKLTLAALFSLFGRALLTSFRRRSKLLVLDMLVSMAD